MFTFFKDGDLLDTLSVSVLGISPQFIDTSETLSQAKLKLNNYTSANDVATIGGIWVGAIQELHIPVVTTFGTYLHYDAVGYLSIDLYEISPDGGEALISSGDWSTTTEVRNGLLLRL